MKYFQFALLIISYFLFPNCTAKAPEVKAPEVITPIEQTPPPSNTQASNLIISKVNYWVERGMFFVAGICSNTTGVWQKISVEMSPLNASGNPITLGNQNVAIIPTFSDAVPPSGRSSFFASWPVSAFSEAPASCIIKEGKISPQPAGPILVAPMVNGIKMLESSAPGQPATEEKAWQITGSISNPLDLVAKHPRLEILVFGTDNKLWFSTILNPEDAATKPYFKFERSGAIKAKEERPFSLQVYYDRLPLALKTQKIGRVQILPFDARK